MTSAHSMLARALVAILGALTLLAPGCSSAPRLESPSALASPYARHQLWAVAPFANESGVSDIDVNHVADLFAEQLQHVHGINCLPVNRTILAMHQLKLTRIQSPNQALELMRLLDADGIIVGSISSYDPYRPLKLGASIVLFLNDAPSPLARIDTQQLVRQSTDALALADSRSTDPHAQASGQFDAANHHTLARLQNYARGRSEPDSAFGSQVYLVSMEMFTQFVAHELLRQLLDSEHLRTAQVQVIQPPR